MVQHMEESNVWTDNEGVLLLNFNSVNSESALEHKVNKTQENTMSCLLSSMQWESKGTFIQTHAKSPVRKAEINTMFGMSTITPL